MRLIEIPDDGIIKEFIWRGDSVVGKRRIDLSYMPTIEAEPVRHGRWIYDDVDSGDGTYAPYLDVHCDKCGFETGLEQGQYGWTYGEPFPANYCPNCGAKMDGDDDATN